MAVHGKSKWTDALRLLAWVLLVLAGAATLILAWAALFFAGRQSALPALLQPSAPFTAMAVLLLWCAAFAAYSIPRLREGRPFALLVIGGAALSGLVLGIVSVAPCTRAQDAALTPDLVLTPLWQTMVLFVGTSPASFGPGEVCGEAVPLAAQLARFAAMAAVFGTAVAVALTVAVRQWNRIWARMIRHDELVIGANAESLPIIKTLLEWSDDLGKDADHRVHIAVLSLPGEEAVAQTVRDWGGLVHPVMIGTDQTSPSGTAGDAETSPSSQQTQRSLRPFLTARGRVAVTRVWIMHDDLELALALQSTVIAILQAARPPRKGRKSASTQQVRIVTLCEDRREAQQLRLLQITNEAGTERAPASHSVAAVHARPLGAAKGSDHQADDSVDASTVARTQPEGDAKPQVDARLEPDVKPQVEVIVDPVCPDEVSATEVIGRVAITMKEHFDEAAASEPHDATDRKEPGYHLVICGDTALADAMLQAVALRCWEDRQLTIAWNRCLRDRAAASLQNEVNEQDDEAKPSEAECDPCGRVAASHWLKLSEAFDSSYDPNDLLVGGAMPELVIVVAPTADDLIDQWRRSASPIVREAVAMIAVCKEWTQLTRDDLPAGRLAVVLTESVDPSKSHLSERLRLRLRADCVRMWVLSRHQAKSCPSSFADHEEAFAGNILLNGRLPEDYWTRMARLQHEVYRRREFKFAKDSQAVHERRLPWWHSDSKQHLAPAPGQDWGREGNLRQVRTFHRWLVQLGHPWRRIDPDASRWTPPDDLVTTLAQLEIYRWNLPPEHKGPSSLDPRVIQASACQAAWDDKSDPDWAVNQRKTISTIRANFELMQALGFVPQVEREMRRPAAIHSSTQEPR